MSYYKVPDTAAGRDRIYGSFPGCRILGHDCTITIDELPDRDPQVADLGGNGTVFRRGGYAIHISGLDPYGTKTGPGFIRAIGLYSIRWHDTDSPPAGLGWRRPEPAAIVSWDGDVTGRSHRTDEWQHFAMFERCRSIVTLDGIVDLLHTRYGHDRPFRPLTICQLLDAVHGRSADDIMSYTDKQHVRAVRRLLEAAVDVRNQYVNSDYTVRRSGRWAYTLEGAFTDSVLR